MVALPLRDHFKMQGNFTTEKHNRKIKETENPISIKRIQRIEPSKQSQSINNFNWNETAIPPICVTEILPICVTETMLMMFCN